MKWLVLGVLVCLVGYGEGGALKCTPGSKDSSCSEEVQSKDPANQIPTDETKETADVQAECLAGTEWNSNCHKCTCSEKGLAECVKQEECKQEVPGDPIKCKPITHFRRGCHSCMCLDDGRILCSMTCPDSSDIKDQLPQGKECAPGTTWKSQCNDCGCTQNGEYFCTKKNCSEEDDGTEKKCAPDSRWRLDCNTCWCVDGNAACTAMGCIPGPTDKKDEQPQGKDELPQGIECAPGTTWKSQCNDCGCTQKGEYYCTRKDCLSEENKREKKCAPGSRWKLECNDCWCDDGSAVCHQMGCISGPPDMYDLPKGKDDSSIELPQGKECAPGTTWKSQCNDCGCTQNGEYFCTRKTCLPDEKGREMKCAPGSRWRYECNTCWCSDGVAACTQKGCDTFQLAITVEKEGNNLVNAEVPAAEQHKSNPKYISEDTNLVKRESDLEYYDQIFHDGNRDIDDPEESQEELINLLDRDEDYSDRNLEMNHSVPQVEDVHNVLKRSVCKPNQDFQSECNACKCASDGLSYRCTHNECMEGETNKEVEVFMENEGTDHIEKHSVCKPQGTFYIGCNTCHCNLFGTDYSCTNKPCPLPEDVELFHELKELRVIMKECRPDEVFELDCNMCRCNPDGKSYSCTRRACVEPVDEEQKNSTISRKTRGVAQTAPKACQAGQEFRMDCNTCLCNNEGEDFSCTRNDCNAQNNNHASASVRTKRDAPTSEKVVMECVPGSVFDKDCNVCRCTNDGGHAVCTNKRCSTPAKTEEDDATAAPEQDPNFRCDPGEQFKRGCKDCSCSADGKSVFCTVRFCDQDITPPPSS